MSKEDIDSAQEVKSRTPFWKFYTDDWIGGVIGFTLEQEGFYHRILARMWTRQGGLPNDPIWLSRALNLHMRKTRRLLKFLLAEEKIHIQGDLIINKRIMRDIATYAKQRSGGGTRGSPAKKFAPSLIEVSSKFDRNLEQTLPESSIESTEMAQVTKHPEARSQNSSSKTKTITTYSNGSSGREKANVVVATILSRVPPRGAA